MSKDKEVRSTALKELTCRGFLILSCPVANVWAVRRNRSSRMNILH